MTWGEFAGVVITLAAAVPVLYLAVSYVDWRWQDESRRRERMIRRGKA